MGGAVGGGSVGAGGGVGTRPGFCPWGGEVGTTRGRVFSKVQLNCCAANGECNLQLKANSALRSHFFICIGNSRLPLWFLTIACLPLKVDPPHPQSVHSNIIVL